MAIRKCPVCGRMIGLMKCRHFRKHGNRYNPCEGSWRPEWWTPEKQDDKQDDKVTHDEPRNPN